MARQPNASTGKASALALRITVLLIPVLLYLPAAIKGVAFPPGQSRFSDLLINHYPNLIYLRDAILQYRQLPLWNGAIYSGVPFAADPLAGLFYLPGWLGMLSPTPAGLAFTMAAHASFGAWGMYLFLRSLEVGEGGSLAGALAWGLFPKFGALLGAGHVSLIYALHWTPWLFWIGQRDRQGWKSGAAAGMLFLADPRWAVYAGITWGVYQIAHRQSRVFERFLFLAKSGLTAILIAAPLLFPMLEYIPLTTRAHLTSSDVLQFSLPLPQLIGLIIPGSGGNIEWAIYGGGVVTALVVLQLFDREARKRNAFWLITAAVSLAAALDIWNWTGSWIGTLPGFSLLRIPTRWIFILGFSLAMITGKTLDSLERQGEEHGKSRLVAFGTAALSLALAVSLIFMEGKIELPLIWGFLFAAGTALIMYLTGTRATAAWHWILTGMLALDLLGAGWMYFRIDADYLRVGPGIMGRLETDEEDFRVYSPSYSLPQNEAALASIQMTDGVDPLQIAEYAAFMEDATGVAAHSYSVSIPPFETGNPGLDNQTAVPDPALLGLLNVKYLLADFPLDVPELSLEAEQGTQYLYRNELFLPRAWVETDVGAADSPRTGVKLTNVGDLRWSPNRIQIQCQGPGLLVLSEIAYPGWRVSIDGEPASLEKAYSILRSVRLPAGSHRVDFVYRPRSVFLGLALAALGWSGLAFLARKEKFEEVSV